jgi:hypothetical protein
MDRTGSVVVEYREREAYRNTLKIDTQHDVLLTVHHGTLMNQHQLDALFLVCVLEVNTPTCFGRYSPIFRRLCTDAI